MRVTDGVNEAATYSVKASPSIYTAPLRCLALASTASCPWNPSCVEAYRRRPGLPVARIRTSDEPWRLIVMSAITLVVVSLLDRLDIMWWSQAVGV